MPVPEERRKHFRLGSRIPMRYRKIETNSREFKGSLLKNISVGGAGMTLYEFLALNSKLAMEIPLVSGKKPVKGVCRVAWVKKAPFGEQYEVGLEFVNLNQGDESYLADFVFQKSFGNIATAEL